MDYAYSLAETLLGVLLLFTSAMFWIAYWVGRRRHHLLAALEVSVVWSVLGSLLELRWPILGTQKGAHLALGAFICIAAVLAFAGMMVLTYEVGLLGKPPEPRHSRGTPWLWRNIGLVKGVFAAAIVLVGIMVFAGVIGLSSWPTIPEESLNSELGRWLFSGLLVFHLLVLMAGFVMAYCQAVQYARLCAEEARRPD